MSSDFEGFLEAARKDLGYREQNNGYSKFGEWYYQTIDNSDSYFATAPWCDMFITWAAHQAGVLEYVGEFAYTVDHAKWFKDQGAWSETPEPGAIVFYDWSGSRSVEAIDHAGIVEQVEGSKIFTIEANVDKVWLKRKERGQDKVVGYGLPRKVREAKDGEPASLVESGASAEALAAESGTRKTHQVLLASRPPAPVELPTIQEAIIPVAVLTALVVAMILVARLCHRTATLPGRSRRRRMDRRQRSVPT